MTRRCTFTTHSSSTTLNSSHHPRCLSIHPSNFSPTVLEILSSRIRSCTKVWLELFCMQLKPPDLTSHLQSVECLGSSQLHINHTGRLYSSLPATSSTLPATPWSMMVKGRMWNWSDMLMQTGQVTWIHEDLPLDMCSCMEDVQCLGAVEDSPQLPCLQHKQSAWLPVRLLLKQLAMWIPL